MQIDLWPNAGSGIPGLQVPFDDGLILTGVVTAAGIVAALFFFGATRFVSAANVLDNPERRAIHDHVKNHPGIHLRGLARALDLTTTNVLWHVRKLEAARLVASQRANGYRVYYSTEGGRETRREAVGRAVLRNDNARRLLAYVAAHPGVHPRAIARAIRLNHGTVRWHVDRLHDAELLLVVRDGTVTRCYASETGAGYLDATAGSLRGRSETGSENGARQKA